MTTAIYLRISQDIGLTRGGVKRQLADCEKLCKTNGWAPTRVYEDNDISAYSGKKRPGYNAMLAAVSEGEVDRIVAWHPDRLHRSLNELQTFIKVVETSGCAVATVLEGQYDLTTTGGRMTARILGSVAQAESEHRSERSRRKTLELAQAGQFVGGGVRPYGYRKIVVDGRTTLRIDKKEAVEVAAMVDKFLAGESARSIAAGLRHRGVPTVRGGEWRSNTVLNVVCSPTISGQREHLGRIVAPGTWPPIVTPAETARAQALAASRRQDVPRDRGEHLLTGMCRCAACGERMHTGHSGGRGRVSVGVVRCSPPPNGCGRVSIRRDPLEQLVVEAVFQLVDATQLPAVDRRTPKPDDSEDQLAELAQAYADKLISMGEWVVARDRIQERVSQAAQADAGTWSRDAAIRPFVRRRGALAAAWNDLPLGQRRAIVAAVIDRIEIAPGVKGRNWFDDGRVDIRWRD